MPVMLDLETKLPVRTKTPAGETKPAEKETVAAPPDPNVIESDLKLTPKERTAQRRAFMESNGFSYQPEGEDKVEDDKDAVAEKEAADKKAAEEDAAAEAKEKEEKEKADAAAAETEKPAKPAKADEPKPKVKKRETPAAAPVDVEAVADRAADRAMERAAKAKEAEGKPAGATVPPADPDAGLTYAERKEIKILGKISALHPDVGDIAGKMRTFWAQEREYRKKWEAEHPDDEFDDTAHEHDRFYRDEPTYKAEHHDEAVAAIEDERIDERAAKKAQEIIDARVEPEMRKRRAAEAWQNTAPEIKTNADSALVEMIEKTSPDFFKMLPQQDGKAALSPDAAKKMVESDPVAYEIVNDEARRLHALVVELQRLDKLGEFYHVNSAMAVNIGSAEEPEPFYVHNELLNFISAQEQAILASPPANQIFEGKRFVPLAQYHAMQDAVLKQKLSPAAQKAALAQNDAKFWSLETSDITTMLVAFYSKRAKKQLQRVETYATKRNGKPTSSSEKPAENGAPAGEEKPAKPLPGTKRSNPPSVTSASDTLNTEKRGTATPATQQEAVRQTWE